MKAGRFLIVLSVALFLLTFSANGYGGSDDRKKLAIFPFTVNANGNLGFLKQGVLDMLTSRLAGKKRLDILDKGIVLKACAGVTGEMGKAKALQIGETLGVDYVVLGSLTVFGENISIDAKILDINNSEVLLTAYDHGKGMDGLMPAVNRFAGEINSRITGGGVASQESESGESGYGESHGNALVALGEDGFESRRRPSLVRRLKAEIRGVDMGDVDGDGKTELILIDKRKVFVYKWKKGPYLFKVIEGVWSANYIYMNAADLDGNGRDEVYVSNATETGTASFVLEWDGSQFKEIVNDQDWLIRITDLPGMGRVILGQKRNAEGNYSGRVHILKRQGPDFVPAAPLDLPRFGNVFNFIQCDLSGEGARSTVLLGPWEHLEVYGPAGGHLWKSDQFFGGSLCGMEYFDPNVNRMAHTGERLFVASPIFAHDVDGDGISEVVVCKNESKTARMLSSFRWFGSGRVHFLAWDEVGLVSRWMSPKLSGPVVGYQVGDPDDDGLKELVMANVTRDSFGVSKTRLVMYDME